MQSYNLGLFFLLALPFLLLNRIGFWMLFKKAGVSPWKSLVPGLNWWCWVKIVGRPTYYFFLLFVPIINPIIWFTLSIDLMKSFGRFKFSEQVMGTLFQFIYTVYIGFKKDVVYLGPAESEEFQTKYKTAKSFGRDWADAIWFAVMVASLVRMIYVEPYQIPTSSMERSLRVGDYLFVSKIHNGFRIPSTPISIPFVHRDLAGVTSYNSSVVLPYMRFPGWVKVKSGDATVFNWPGDDASYPTDKKMNFIKRCVAEPGDTLRVKNGRVFIDQTRIPQEVQEQTSYVVGTMRYPINEKALDKLDIYDYVPMHYYGDTVDARGNIVNYYYNWYNNFPKTSKIRRMPFHNLMVMNTTPKVVEELREKGIIDMYLKEMDRPASVYPKTGEAPFVDQTFDNCGPYYCPKRGDEIDLTNKLNFELYKTVIMRFEDLEDVSSDGFSISVKGEKLDKYTFKYNYYWMMGDNRHNSADSREWGFVPESHILGKPLMVLFSIQYKGVLIPGAMGERKNSMYKIRLNRLFKTIN